MTTLSAKQLVGYGALGVPLAFVGLPIYVHLPHYYATTHGMALTTIGLLLLLVRLLDACLDPFIGFYSDRLIHYRRRILIVGLLPLTVGFIALFSPPAWQADALLYWLGGALIITYVAFSVVMINYYAAAMNISTEKQASTLISGVREGALLVGVVIAAALPALLQERYGAVQGFYYFSLCFIPLVLIGAMGISYSMKHTVSIAPAAAARVTWKEVRLLRGFLPYYVLFFLNSLPTSMTSNLFLFYVEDVLRVPEQAGYMLLTFFISAACGVPLWIWLAKKKGQWWALRVAMMVAIISFSLTCLLRAGDAPLFYVICMMSGFAIGGDLTLLPAIFTHALSSYAKVSSVAFSVWHFLAKCNLAIVAGIALPLLSYAGYQPQVVTEESSMMLIMGYGVIPCVIKCVALYATIGVERTVAVIKSSHT